MLNIRVIKVEVTRPSTCGSPTACWVETLKTAKSDSNRARFSLRVSYIVFFLVITHLGCPLSTNVACWQVT